MAESGDQVFKVIPHQEDFRTLKQKRGKRDRAESARSWLESSVTPPSTHSCWSRACQSCGHLGREPKKPPGQGRDSGLQVQRIEQHRLSRGHCQQARLCPPPQYSHTREASPFDHPGLVPQVPSQGSISLLPLPAPICLLLYPNASGCPRHGDLPPPGVIQRLLNL